MYQLLTDDEIQRVIAQARQYGEPKHRLKYVALLTLLANYGPRISEALALRWRDVDFSRKTITLKTLKRRKPASRTLPLMDGVASTLADYRSTVNGDPRVFPFTAYGRCVVWHAFQVLLDRAGIPRKKVHALRHSAVSRWAELDVVLARDIAGHANISTTNEYAHVRRMQEKMQMLQAIT